MLQNYSNNRNIKSILPEINKIIASLSQSTSSLTQNTSENLSLLITDLIGQCCTLKNQQTEIYVINLFEKFVEQYNRGVKVIQLTQQIFNLYLNMGFLFYKQGELKISKKIFLQALKDYEVITQSNKLQLDQQIQVVILYSNLSNIYYRLHKIQKSYDYAQIALQKLEPFLYQQFKQDVKHNSFLDLLLMMINQYYNLAKGFQILQVLDNNFGNQNGQNINPIKFYQTAYTLAKKFLGPQHTWTAKMANAINSSAINIVQITHQINSQTNSIKKRMKNILKKNANKQEELINHKLKTSVHLKRGLDIQNKKQNQFFSVSSNTNLFFNNNNDNSNQSQTINKGENYRMKQQIKDLGDQVKSLQDKITEMKTNEENNRSLYKQQVQDISQMNQTLNNENQSQKKQMQSQQQEIDKLKLENYQLHQFLRLQSTKSVDTPKKQMLNDSRRLSYRQDEENKQSIMLSSLSSNIMPPSEIPVQLSLLKSPSKLSQSKSFGIVNDFFIEIQFCQQQLNGDSYQLMITATKENKNLKIQLSYNQLIKVLGQVFFRDVLNPLLNVVSICDFNLFCNVFIIPFLVIKDTIEIWPVAPGLIPQFQINLLGENCYVFLHSVMGQQLFKLSFKSVKNALLCFNVEISFDQNSFQLIADKTSEKYKDVTLTQIKIKDQQICLSLIQSLVKDLDLFLRSCDVNYFLDLTETKILVQVNIRQEFKKVQLSFLRESQGEIQISMQNLYETYTIKGLEKLFCNLKLSTSSINQKMKVNFYDLHNLEIPVILYLYLQSFELLESEIEKKDYSKDNQIFDMPVDSSFSIRKYIREDNYFDVLDLQVFGFRNIPLFVSASYFSYERYTQFACIYTLDNYQDYFIGATKKKERKYEKLDKIVLEYSIIETLKAKINDIKLINSATGAKLQLKNDNKLIIDRFQNL